MTTEEKLRGEVEKLSAKLRATSRQEMEAQSETRRLIDLLPGPEEEDRKARIILKQILTDDVGVAHRDFKAVKSERDALRGEVAALREALKRIQHHATRMDLSGAQHFADITVDALASDAGKSEAAVIAAARKLYGALNVVHASPECRAMFTLAAVHGEEYSGPTYGEEQKALGAALDALEAETSAMPQQAPKGGPTGRGK